MFVPLEIILGVERGTSRRVNRPRLINALVLSFTEVRYTLRSSAETKTQACCQKVVKSISRVSNKNIENTINTTDLECKEPTATIASECIQGTQWISTSV